MIISQFVILTAINVIRGVTQSSIIEYERKTISHHSNKANIWSNLKNPSSEM
jgi:hypothetical protein